MQERDRKALALIGGGNGFVGGIVALLVLSGLAYAIAMLILGRQL